MGILDFGWCRRWRCRRREAPGWMRTDLFVAPARGIVGLACGWTRLCRPARFFDVHEGANGGLIRGIVTVDEYYASTRGLRKAAKKLADEKQAVFTMHFLVQHREYFEDMVRTGKSPVQLLAEEGVLSANTILAHRIHIGSNSLINYPLVDDIGILGAPGCRCRILHPDTRGAA